MPLERSGYLEETFITFSFAALRDDQNSPNGIFCTAIENTARIIAERQINCLRALAARSSSAETPQAACQTAMATLEGNPRDLPFVALYLLDNGKRAHLAGTAGLICVPPGIPTVIDLESEGSCAIARVATTRSAQLIDNVQPVIQGFMRTPEITPQHASALPILNPGTEQLAAILVAGVNPMRPPQESRAFHELVANHLETVISNARAKQHARERAQALAELDHAKTLFFSNISHELRTPLTLLLAPLDDALARTTLGTADRSLLEIARRGGGRLLKLVNSLLEFSRIEAGRIEASYEATDLASLTTDLASVFRSAFERGGVALTLDCPKLPEDVFVDRDMWEKIVLNLISNAFKFTLKGEVRVSQQAFADHIQLQVSDTGCGVAEDDLPRLFERFFRGRTSQARTHEGSGIGLSLVQELVKLHGGSIEASSELGVGTTITLRIPRGCAHLPADRIGSVRKLERARIGALPFVEEALGWLPDDVRRDGRDVAVREDTPAEELPNTAPAETHPGDVTAARILVVDDNADMRSYLCRLLGDRWQVETAPDGAAALEHIQQRAPDLVIADIMMPVIDGFGLLRAIRTSEATAKLPVMLLSARAGEEASAEGLRAGADDYVIKPFTARELMARVESRLVQARLHAAERRALKAAEQANQARDVFFTMLSHELRTPLMAVLSWTAMLKGNRLDPTEVTHALDLIERNARVQRRLVDDLLDISRIVTDRLRIEPRPITCLAQMISVVVDSFQPAALAKNLTVETELEPDAGAVKGDSERLQQVVWNLLSNAIRYTPAGGRIQVRLARRGDQVELMVRDSGQGIAPEALPHLFERYWQGQDSERRSQGLGLGLAIAHRIIELHKGEIIAASDGEGRGATFTVLLPLLTSDTQDSVASADGATVSDLDTATLSNVRMLDAATSELEAASRAAHLHELPAESETCKVPHALRILLVEDHDGVAKACRRLLTSHGHSVVWAPGLEAATLAAERDTFDILICDLTLPDGSGIELLSRMRSRFPRMGSDGRLPAIAISGSVYEEDVARSLRAGFGLHLAKPFDEESLLAAVRKVTFPESAL
jgi:signal transduction histidine kinase